MRFVGALIVWIIIGIIAYFVVAYTGAYSVGADVPHWGVTRQAIGFLREHTLDRRAAEITPPPLDNPALVQQGARDYAQMCVGCHLAPGLAHSDLREGLYPRPPNLTRFAPRPAEAFWIIKHGLKMTAMPAWGKSHSDQQIWAMVAYLQKQPKMNAAEFHLLIAGATTRSHPQVAPAATVLPPPPMGSGAPAGPTDAVPASSAR